MVRAAPMRPASRSSGDPAEQRPRRDLDDDPAVWPRRIWLHSFTYDHIQTRQQQVADAMARAGQTACSTSPP